MALEQKRDKSTYISPEEQLQILMDNPYFSKEKKKAAYEKYKMFNKFNKGKYYATRSYGSNIMNVPWCPHYSCDGSVCTQGTI